MNNKCRRYGVYAIVLIIVWCMVLGCTTPGVSPHEPAQTGYKTVHVSDIDIAITNTAMVTLLS